MGSTYYEEHSGGNVCIGDNKLNGDSYDANTVKWRVGGYKPSPASVGFESGSGKDQPDMGSGHGAGYGK